MSECVASALGNWEAGVCGEDWALKPTPYVPRVGSCWIGGQRKKPVPVLER